MDYEEYPSEQVLFDDRVINVLVRKDPETISKFTEDLNRYLQRVTGSTMLVPVISGDSYEDIIMWSSEIESVKLREWMDKTWYSSSYMDVGEWEPTHIVAVAMFCSNTHRVLRDHYVGFLKRSSLLYRKMAFEYLKYVATEECELSLEDFYSIIEEFGLAEMLIYDDGYPLEKRQRLMSQYVKSLCSNVLSGSRETSGVLETSLAIVYAESMYKNPKELVDKLLVGYFRDIRGPPTPRRVNKFVLNVLKYSDYASSAGDELINSSKDAIALALRILEDMYNFIIVEDTVAESTDESVQRGYLYLFPVQV